MPRGNRTIKPDKRRHMLVARLRRRQLELARQGRVTDSARMAGRVGRVRRLA